MGGEGEPLRPEYYCKTNARNKVNYTIATRGGDGWNGTVSGWADGGGGEAGEGARSARDKWLRDSEEYLISKRIFMRTGVENSTTLRSFPRTRSRKRRKWIFYWRR